MFVNFNILNQLGSPAINSNTFANRPAAGQTGRLFVSTDTFEIYRDNGTGWDLIGGPGSSTITGSGTTNYVAKFTGTNSIGNSSIFANTSGRVSIGNTNDVYDLDVTGTIRASSNVTVNNGTIAGQITTNLVGLLVTSSTSHPLILGVINNEVARFTTAGLFGVNTTTPTARIEAVQTDGFGIYSNFTTNTGSGASTTGIYSINNTTGSGYAAVIEEKTTNTTGGQYPLLVKHSLSSGTAAAGMGTGLQFQLPDDAGTFKTTQLTIETTDAAAATYASRYRFNVQSNGSSTPVAYLNATGLGLFTATPGAALDIHSTGVMAQLNSTSATANSLLAFQRSGSGLWRIGDNYNSGSNFFELYNTALSTNAIAVLAATNKTEFTAVQTYTTGLARGNYFAYNLTAAGGTSFSSPNSISAIGASLNLLLGGSATIPSGSRSGLDAYNTVSFTGSGTLTQSQGSQIRAYSNLTTGWAFAGSATGTITHLAGLRVLFPDNSGSAVTITNNYGLLINDQTANTGTVTYTNRWGIYQEGASDLNYLNANLLLGSTTNNGNKLQVTGNANITQLLGIGVTNPLGALHVATFAQYSYFASNSATATLSDIQGLQIGWNRSAGNGETLLIYNKGAGSDGGLVFANNNGGSYAERMRLTDSGNLGLGTSTPNANLQVTSAAFPVVKIADGIGGGALSLGDSTISSNYVGIWRGQQNSITGGNILNIQGDGISFMAGNNVFGSATESMRLNNSGNLFISANASTPPISARLNAVATAGGYALALSDNVNASLYVNILNGGAIIGTDPSGIIRFATNGSDAAAEKARIVANGNFIIGTTTDGGAKLAVNGATSINTTTNGTYSKLIVAGAIHCDNNTTASTTEQNQYGNFYGNKSSVTGGAGATTIYSNCGPEGSLFVVSGFFITSGQRFVDLVLVLGAVTTAPVVVSSQNYNSPPTRTYTNTGETIKVELSGTDTYTVFVTGMGCNEKT